MIVSLFTTSTGLAIIAVAFTLLVGWAIIAAYLTKCDRIEMRLVLDKRRDPLWHWRESFLQSKDILYRHIQLRMTFRDFRDLYRPAFYCDELYEERQEP